MIHARAVSTLLSVSFLFAVAACSSEPELVFDDWLIPVPEGVTVKEHAPVPSEERDPDAIRLVDDLVIGTDLSNPEAVLYEPGGIVAAPDGTIFVADRGNNDIKMFDADGTYLKTLGQEGQGPGEFSFISSITIAGDKLVIRDSRNSRMSVWTLDGEHVADHAPADQRSLLGIEGLSDGTLVGYFTERDEDRSGRRILVQSSVEGEELARILEVPMPAPEPFSSREPLVILQSALDSFDNPRMATQVGGGEVVYVSPIFEYQVLAYSPSGEMLWALRTAWDRDPWSDSTRQAMLQSFESSGFGEQIDDPLRPDDFTWPDEFNALSSLASDGQGRLFAIIAPQMAWDEENETTQRPEEYLVDAYDPAGEFLAAGVVPYLWSYARGDYVYGTRPDANDEMVVVRYRLMVNGQ